MIDRVYAVLDHSDPDHLVVDLTGSCKCMRVDSQSGTRRFFYLTEMKRFQFQNFGGRNLSVMREGKRVVDVFMCFQKKGIKSLGIYVPTIAVRPIVDLIFVDALEFVHLVNSVAQTFKLATPTGEEWVMETIDRVQLNFDPHDEPFFSEEAKQLPWSTVKA